MDLPTKSELFVSTMDIFKMVVPECIKFRNSGLRDTSEARFEPSFDMHAAALVWPQFRRAV